MVTHPSQPDRTWRLETRWADLLIILLVLVALLMAWGSVQRRTKNRTNVEQITLNGRIVDLQVSALGTKTPWATVEKQARSPWDKAILAVHAAETGKPELANRCLAEAPPVFVPIWKRAYASGPPCEPQTIALAGKGLERTHATSLLHARLQEADGRDASTLRRQARNELWKRLALLGAMGGGAALFLVGGVGFAIFLILKKPVVPATLPTVTSDGRTLALLFLGWFLAMQVSGTVVQIVLGLLPFLKPWQLPLAYLFHAGFATTMLCRMEGINLAELWRRMTPGPLGRNLSWGLGYLGLTVLSALALSVVLSPFLPSQEPPQRELVEVMTKAKGFHTVLPLFLTVAVLAPCFEELLFRGCLIPALRRRLPRWPALLLGALAFGAMHLQPLGLPMLSLLGLTMGLAFMRTGSIWTSILVHGCWNGAQFLLMRAIY